MDLGQWIVIIISAVFGGWYFIGAIFNRRRGVAVLNWLRPGLEKLGKLTEARWIGSSGSGARLVVAQATAPFQRIEAIFLLESREILPLWIFNRLRRKRDEMIIKASLRSNPVQELEVARTGDREFHKLVSGDVKKPFELISTLPGYDLARRGRENQLEIDKLSAFLGAYDSGVWRVSLQKKAPHLILRANLPDLQKGKAEDFFLALRDLIA